MHSCLQEESVNAQKDTLLAAWMLLPVWVRECKKKREREIFTIASHLHQRRGSSACHHQRGNKEQGSVLCQQLESCDRRPSGKRRTEEEE